MAQDEKKRKKVTVPGEIKPIRIILFLVIFWGSVAAFMGLLLYLMNL